MKDLIEANLYSLNQLEELLQQMEPEEYSRKLSLLSDASIGMHTRHVLEFYDLLLKSTGEVSYDDRPRRLDLQEDVDMALAFIAGLKRRIPLVDNDIELTFKAGYDPESEKSTEVPSIFSRELAFNLEHCIHHMALIKVGLKELESNCKLPESFGVAPSTLRAMRLSTLSK